MRFIDDVDNSPVADAQVTYCATAWGGTLTGHGGGAAILFRFETTTNSGGELKLTPQKFEARPFGMSTNYNASKLLIFKSGYEPHKIVNWGASFGEYRSVSTWAYNGMSIRLKRADQADAKPPPSAAVTPTECGEGWAPPVDPRTVAPTIPASPPPARAPQKLEQDRGAAQPAQTR